MVFGPLLGQFIKQTFDPAAFPVWIPLAFGLVVGLAYVIASGVRRSR